MYLLSQGKVIGLKTDNTYWGYNKLQQSIRLAQMCYAYESVPSCLDLDYDPGGSLSWTTTQTSGGPSLSGDSGTFTTADNCISSSSLLLLTFVFKAVAQLLADTAALRFLEMTAGCLGHTQ